MKQYKIAETVTHYHMIEIDDDIDINEVINSARGLLPISMTGVDAIETVLDNDKKKSNTDYIIHRDYYGETLDNLYVM